MSDSTLKKVLKAVFGSPPSGKFGTFAGVFTPSILTILGVIMFLRFPWVVGNVGVLGAVAMVIIAHMLTVPTALSVASIATNRTVKAGGDYYMLSRSLGLEVGGAIGIGLFFAQALSVSLYVLGFTEAFVDVFPGLPAPAVSYATVIILAGLAFWDTSLALKTQYIIMALIALSLVSIFTGHGPNPPEHVPLWGETVNGKPPQPFAAVFAVFFPAVTGFTQGVSMSGDLENPRKAIPVGTLAAVAVGFLVYVALMVWLGIQVRPEVLRDPNRIVMKEIARWGSLVTLGIWGATLSSAMGSILGAPRILQALAKDRIVYHKLAKGSGPTNMPRVATIFSLGVAMAGLALAYTSRNGLNAIASVITMFFLASYGFVSLACGLATWSRIPSFRPTFRVPSLVSLAGAAGCFYMMSLINLPAMVAAVLIVGGIYAWLRRRDIPRTWGDMRHGIWAALVRDGLRVLQEVKYHPINWQPHVLVLGGSPFARSHLLHFGRWIGNRGIVTYCTLVTGDPVERAARWEGEQEGLRKTIQRVYPEVLTKLIVAPDLYDGMLEAAQAYGLVGYEPNIIVMGWSRDEERRPQFVRLVRTLAALDKCLFLVCVKESAATVRDTGRLKLPDSRSAAPDPSKSLSTTAEPLTEVRGFGRCRSIDIWWGGLQNNGGLMLLAASLVTENRLWENARIRLKMIVREGANIRRVRAELQRIVNEAKVPAEPEILVRTPPDKPIEDIIAERSSADLVLLGLRPPGPDESDDAFVERIERLVERLPTTILVRSSREFEGGQMLLDEDFFLKKPPAGDGS